MKIRILGTGMVGKALGRALVAEAMRLPPTLF
jgi:predicted dinucleotide-binding enzyme